MIMYTEKRIEEAETVGPQPSQTPVNPAAKSLDAPKVMTMRSKAKAMPHPVEEEMTEPEMLLEPAHGLPQKIE